MKIHYSAPGKLFLSGEWAILEMGTKGMVAAVNSRVHATVDNLENYEGISVSADDFGVKNAMAKYAGGKLVFTNVDDKTRDTLKLLGEAISTTLNFLASKKIAFKPFKISTSSRDLQITMEGQPKKVGFGSSAAVVVAAVAAVLDFHEYNAAKEEIYKLATIAHYFAQGKVGSAFDVAASAYGGVFVYSRFDPDWLTKKMEAGEKLDSIVEEKWPGFYVEQLTIPDNFHLLIGWTKQEASTSAMVKQMNEFKKQNFEKYDKVIKRVSYYANNAIEAWKENDFEKLIIELQNNREALSSLGKISGVTIETPDLYRLAEIANSQGAAGKLSGAGGGDCGIAVCFDAETAGKIISEWKTAGIYPLETTLDHDGVRKEK